MTTKKIYANKNDSCAAVVHKVISSGLDEFILYLPKGSAIAEDPKNFKLLKREAAAVGKKVIIESVDGNLLKIAASAGFEVMDGLFHRSDLSSSKAPIMDIVPIKSKLEKLSTKKAPKNPLLSKNLNKISLPEQAREDDVKNQLDDSRTAKEYQTDESGEYTHSHRARPSLKKVGLIVFLTAILIFAGYLSFVILPSARISIEREKIDWPFTGTIVASVRTPDVSVNNSLIPAQIFTVSKNGVYQFPASGSQVVERRASGKITIWNAYSSATQLLVRNTRFATPEGRIYRITSTITVPGARVSEGRIQPSSIEADVIADGAGDAYNTGSVARLSIPGFRGSPKYNGFYGELKTGASGGFTGEIKAPTNDDIRNARETSVANVTSALQSSIIMTIPPEFKVINDAIVHNVVKSEVVSEVNAEGKFSYGVVMEAQVPAYKEEDIIALMRKKFQADRTNSYDLITKNIVYTSSPVVNIASGRMSIPIEFNSAWARSLDPEALRNKILGMNEQSLRATIFAIPGVLNAQANLWPFWVASVPMRPDKIKININ